MQRICRGPDEGLDSQMLLEVSKKDFHLPAVFIDGIDGGSAKAKMIGYQQNGFTGCRATGFNILQWIRKVLATVTSGQFNCLIFEDMRISGRCSGLKHPVGTVVFCLGDKPDALPDKVAKPGNVKK